MKTFKAKYLTVTRADIDPHTSIEIVWQTDPATFQILVFRIHVGTARPFMTTEEIGGFTTIDAVCQHLRVLFGETNARRVAPASQWNFHP